MPKLVNFGIRLFVVQFHVARRIDDRFCSLARAAAVRHRAFVSDRPDENARVVETGKLFFGNAAEVHGQGNGLGHASQFSEGWEEKPTQIGLFVGKKTKSYSDQSQLNYNALIDHGRSKCSFAKRLFRL